MRIKVKLIIKNCLYCGKSFESYKHAKRIFCSIYCHDKFGHTEKAKQKMSKSHTGKKLTIIHKQRISKSVSKALTGKIFSIATKQKMSKFWKERFKDRTKHPRWENGKSFEPYPTTWTKKLKEQIRERDNYTCQNPECNRTQKENGKALDVHHVDYVKENLNLNNLISLCQICHMKTNGNRGYWYAYYIYIMENWK